MIFFGALIAFRAVDRSFNGMGPYRLKQWFHLYLATGRFMANNTSRR